MFTVSIISLFIGDMTGSECLKYLAIAFCVFIVPYLGEGLILVILKIRLKISDVSKRFRQCQVKAAMKVNDEMLRFFWSLGRDMEKKKSDYAWGSRFYSRVSRDLVAALPKVKSFSQRNLQYMNQFYRMFPDAVNTKQAVSQLEAEAIAHQVDAQLAKTEITHRVDAQMGDEIVFCIPWGHIKVILDKCKDDKDKAILLRQLQEIHITLVFWLSVKSMTRKN